MHLLNIHETQIVSGSNFNEYMDMDYVGSTVANLAAGGSGAVLGVGLAKKYADVGLGMNFGVRLAAVAGCIIGYHVGRGIQEWYYSLYNANNPTFPVK